MDLSYEEVYRLSISEPGRFWDQHAKDVIWDKPYTSVLEDKESINPKWFVGGEINMSYNCLDRQVEEGYGTDVAFIYESPLTKTIEKITYNELLRSVELLAGVMVQRCGLVKGDRVLFYLPVIPQCMTGLMACTRIGAIHTFINAGFGYKEIAMRIKHFEPKLIITSNVGGPSNEFTDFKSKVDSAIQLCGFAPDFCIVCNLPNHGKAKMNDLIDLDWDEEMSKAKPQGPMPVESDHPLYVNYTSGTTGDPKGLVIPTGAAVVAFKYYMKYIYDLKPYETIFIMSSFSWILGGSVMTYGALMSRNPTIVYEGKISNRSDILEIIRIINEHKVVFLTTTPTVMRIKRKYCTADDIPLNSFNTLRGIYLTGEVYKQSLKDYIQKSFNCPVYDVWGQTELGGPMKTPLLGYRRSVEQDPNNIKSVLLPGVIAKILDRDSGKELPNGTKGRLVLKLPLNPVKASTIFKNDKRFFEIYFKTYPGYYDTMDSAVILDDHIHILSRDDNIIHVASTRINGYAVEEACLQDKNLDQATIVALEDPIKGFVPFGFLVPKANIQYTEAEIMKNSVKNVIDSVGELACFDQAVVVPELPKNHGGKTLRISLEMMINGKESKVPAMVENRGVYHVIYDILRRAGYNPRLPSEL